MENNKMKDERIIEQENKIYKEGFNLVAALGVIGIIFFGVTQNFQTMYAIIALVLIPCIYVFIRNLKNKNSSFEPHQSVIVRVWKSALVGLLTGGVVVSTIVLNNSNIPVKTLAFRGILGFVLASTAYFFMMSLIGQISKRIADKEENYQEKR